AEALHSTTANSPDLIAQVLLDERNFSLHRNFNIGERSGMTAVGCDTGKNPPWALLVHEAASAIDRVDNNPPPRIALFRAIRQHNAPVRQTFADQNDRLSRRDFLREPFNERRLADLVDRIDHITRTIMRNARQFFRRPLLT